jgi:DNA-binding transcriptional MerR regulator
MTRSEREQASATGREQASATGREQASAAGGGTPAQTPVPMKPLRIQEVAAVVGLTTRSIRYYEEMGLLAPVRSEGAYRLYDPEDVERLRFIKGLRDDAGFSLAEIGRLLEDEAARARNRARFKATEDPIERRALALDGIARIDRQIETLQSKIARLRGMIAEARSRREKLAGRVEVIDGGEARTHVHVTRTSGPVGEPGR